MRLHPPIRIITFCLRNKTGVLNGKFRCDFAQKKRRKKYRFGYRFARYDYIEAVFGSIGKRKYRYFPRRHLCNGFFAQLQRIFGLGQCVPYKAVSGQKDAGISRSRKSDYQTAHKQKSFGGRRFARRVPACALYVFNRLLFGYKTE